MARGRKGTIRRGIKLGDKFPARRAEELTRRYRQLNALGVKLFEEIVFPAIATGDDTAIDIALIKFEEALANSWSDTEIEDIAKQAAKGLDENHLNNYTRVLEGAVKVAAIAGVAGLAGKLAGQIPGGIIQETGATLMTATGIGTPPSTLNVNLRVQLSVGGEFFSQEFVKKNVELIKTLKGGITPAIEELIIREKQFGTGDPRELADRLLKKLKREGVPSQIPTTRLKNNGEPRMLTVKNHVKTIAHDQINKLNSDLNQFRQEAAGVEEYTWRTQGDDRVRASHQALNGTVQRWDSPVPGEGHPGQPINCRCYAEAVIRWK